MTAGRRAGVAAATLAVMIAVAVWSWRGHKAHDRRPPPRPAVVTATATIAGVTSGSFAVNLDGAATYQIPIAVPPGTAGAAPTLALAYTSQGSDGLLGAGWSLSGFPRVERCGATIVADGFRGGVGYDANDRFCLIGAGGEDPRLVPIDAKQGAYFVPGATYRTERESWTRVVASTTVCGGGPCSFTVTLKAGTSYTLGTTADSAVAPIAATTIAPPPSGAIRAWLIAAASDLDGNTIAFTYTQAPPTLTGSALTNPGLPVPLRIDYTSRVADPAQAPMRSVQFFYQARLDPSVGDQAGATTTANVVLAAIQTCIATTAATPVTGLACTGSALQPVKQYTLTYQQNAVTARSQLASVQECDGAGNCLPPTTFTSISGANGQVAVAVPSAQLQSNQGWVADFNGDGRTDLLSQEVPTSCTGSGGTISGALYLATASGFALPPPCVYLPFAQYQGILPADYNGDGYADVLLTTVGSVALFLYAPGQGFPATGTTISLTLAQDVAAADVNGDGLADLVSSDSSTATVLLSTGTGFTAQPTTSGLQLGQPIQIVADFTGDGRADLFSGFGPNGTLYPSTGAGFGGALTSAQLNLGNDGTWAGDFTGDGLPDLTSADAANLYLMIGNGQGFEPAITFANLQLAPGSTWPGDFNGDGVIDLFSAGLSASTIYMASSSSACAASSQAGPCFTAIAAPGTNLVAGTTWLGDFNGDGADDLYAPGTGTQDTLYLAAQGGAPSAPAPDLVTTIVDGGGGQIALGYLPLTDPSVYAPSTGAASQQLDGLLAFQHLGYTPLGAVQTPLYPTIELQIASYVVASVVESNAPAINAIGAYSYAAQYGYQQSLVNLIGRGSLGFATVNIVAPPLGAQTTNLLRQDYPYDGQPATTLVCAAAAPMTPCQPASAGGAPLNAKTFTYACRDTLANQPCAVDNTGYDASATQITQVVTTQTSTQDYTFGSTRQVSYQYDGFANRTRTADLGDVTNGSHPIYTCASYANDTAGWRLGYLERRKLTTDASCRDLTTWNAKRDLRLGWIQYDGRKRVVAELHWDDSQPGWLGTGYAYDGLGNQISDTVLTGATPTAVAGTTYTTTYDPLYRTFAARRTTPVPDPGDPQSAALVTELGHDARFGSEVVRRDPDGTITNRCVDSFGRTATTQGPPPAGTTPDPSCLTAALYPYLPAGLTGNTATATLDQVTWSNAAASLSVQHQARAAWSAPTWTPSTRFVDGLARTARTATEDDTGATIYVDRQYQTPSLVSQRSLPYVAGATPSWIVNTYDPAGRRLSATSPYQAPDGTVGTSQITWGYSAPNTITETQVAASGPSYVTATQFDWFFDQKKIVTRTVATDDDATSTFGYDGLGALTGTVSPPPAGAAQGVVNTATLDSLGRRTVHTESNTGTLRELYDDRGRLARRVDSLGQVVVYAYDNLDRPVRRVARGPSRAVVEIVDYTWDHQPGTVGPARLAGRIARATVSDGNAVQLAYDFDYDAYGNQVRRLVSFPTTKLALFELTAAFDPQRRELARTYPDTDHTTVTHGWGPLSGNLLTLSSATKAAPTPVAYLTYGSYTPFAAPQSVTYASGVTESWRYDAADKPLARTVSGPSATLYASSAYGWDTLDDLTSALDCTYTGNAGAAPCQAIGVSGTGAIDHSQTLAYTALRLTQAIGPFGADLAQATLGYGYDQAGNLTALDTTAYQYDGHQVIGATSGGATTMTARYDADGNLCLRVAGATAPSGCVAPGAAPAGAIAYQYDPYNRLTAVWDGATEVESYTYDDQGRRVTRSGWSDGAIAWTAYYVTDDLIVTVPTGGDARHQLYLPGQRPRAAVAAGAQPPTILHKDLTYSTVARTDGAGAVTSQIVYTPYGQIANETPADSAPTGSLFQGQERDGTGLYHFGRRYQDPGLGRFLSADLVAGATTFGQDALNRYAFSLNRPSVVEDPTGDTPIMTLLVIFQVIFDLADPEVGVPLDVFELFADRTAAGLSSDEALMTLQRDAKELFDAGAINGRDVSAETMAREAASELDAQQLIGKRAKLTVIIGRRGIYAELSGAAARADEVTDAEMTTEMRARRDQVSDLRHLTRADRDSFESWDVSHCAEFRTCQQMSRAGEVIDDTVEMHTVNLQSFTDAPQCRNCSRLTHSLPDDSITSGRTVSRNLVLDEVRTLEAQLEAAAASK